MKKLYFLNEEESKRILNLHKDATKRQYLNVLTEQEQFYKGSDGKVGKSLGPRDLPQGAIKITQQEYDTLIKTQTPVDAEAVVVQKPEVQKPEVQKPEVQKPVQSVNKPLVTKIQQTLKDKGVKLGTTGFNKDGVDGVMGKLTLNGIISLLGSSESLNPEMMVKKEASLNQTPTTYPDDMKLKTTTGTPTAKPAGELTNPITTKSPLDGEQGLETPSVAAASPIIPK